MSTPLGRVINRRRYLDSLGTIPRAREKVRIRRELEARRVAAAQRALGRGLSQHRYPKEDQ